jgi:hypothetical protein
MEEKLLFAAIMPKYAAMMGTVSGNLKSQVLKFIHFYELCIRKVSIQKFRNVPKNCVPLGAYHPSMRTVAGSKGN